MPALRKADRAGGAPVRFYQAGRWGDAVMPPWVRTDADLEVHDEDAGWGGRAGAQRFRVRQLQPLTALGTWSRNLAGNLPMDAAVTGYMTSWRGNPPL